MEIIQKTIGQMLKEIAQRYPDKEALVHTQGGMRYSYSLLLWEISRVSRGLIGLGIEKGDRVILWAPNIPEWIIAQMALARIGALVVPVDPGASGEDLRFVLEQSESSAIIMAEGLENERYIDTVLSVKDEIPALENIVLVSDTSSPETTLWTELTALGDDIKTSALEEREETIGPDDPVAIMYTSGTTGRPKGVVLDHSGLVNKSVFSTERQGLTHEDRLCLFFPLFHMFGNTCIALAGFLKGAALIIPCRTFDPVKILSAIRQEQCTALYASPSMLIGLIDHPRFNRKHWVTVRKGTIGGAPCPMEVMKRLVQDIGVSQITVAYGITEASSWITMTKPDDPLELRVSTIGTPLVGTQVKISDPTTGEDLPPKTQGELCTKGFLMKGYYKMPAATSAAIDREGWFHTGDWGEMDEGGYVKITGRLKDVIVRSGVEIYPSDLEEIIHELPGVSEVQVFGFSHPQKGQEVAAWIRLKGGADLSVDRIGEYTEQKSDKKIDLRYIKFVSEFPMTRSGKVQKFRLAEMAQKEYLDD